MNSGNTVAIFDTSAVYSIRTRNYAPDVFRALNEEVEHAVADGRIRLIQQVTDELEEHSNAPNPDSPGDATATFEWAKSILRTSRAFPPQLDAAAVLKLTQVIRNSHQDWFDSETTADPYVIAEAEILGCSVVSSERPHFVLRGDIIEAIDGRSQLKNNSNRYSTKVSIPDVCLHRRVRHMNLLEFFRSQRWQF